MSQERASATPGRFLEAEAYRPPAVSDPVCGEAEAYLYGLIRPGQKYELETVRRLLALLGDPQRATRWLQIGGTNGKGSTAATLAAILSAAGHRTGLFTSPHLVSLRERSRVDGEAMSREELAALVPRLRDAILEMESRYGEPPSFFEALFALSCLHLRERAVGVAVAEVGLGGRLDATTALDPLVTVLTTVSEDHVATLGPTLADIAREKCGIAKPGVPFLSAVADPALVAVVDRHAGERGGAVHHLDREVGVTEPEVTLSGTAFTLTLPGRAPRRLHTRLVGRHQARNAAHAAWAASWLPPDLAPPEEAVDAGLRAVQWPARFEPCGGSPFALWDAGHNPEGMDALVATFREVLPGRRATVLAGFSADKELSEMLRALATVTDSLVITRSTHWRAADPATVAQRWQELGLTPEVRAVADPKEALQEARSRAGTDGLVLCTGSIYLLGELSPLAPAAGLAAPRV